MGLRAGIADVDQTKGLDVFQTNRRTSGVLFILTRQLIKTASFDPVPPNDVTFLLLFLLLFCRGGKKGRSQVVCSFDVDSNRWQARRSRASSLFFSGSSSSRATSKCQHGPSLSCFSSSTSRAVCLIFFRPPLFCLKEAAEILSRAEPPRLLRETH